MKLPAIKALLEHDLETLQQAELDLSEERTPNIEIKGDDEGEQLTHVFGAIWIKESVAKGTHTEREALRAFTQKVRNSIS
jgi:hypothetical protein